MSEDRILKTPLLTSKIAIEDIKASEILKKTAIPTSITITANGHEVQSNLNPNALEFIPSYFRKTPQLNLNKKIYDQIVRTKSLNIENEFIIEETNDEKLDPNFSKIAESVGTKTISQYVRNFAKEKGNNNEDNKLGNPVYVLFASSSAEINKSSEIVRSVLTGSEIENSSLDIRKENEEKHYDKKEEHFVGDLEAMNISNVDKLDGHVGIQDSSKDVRCFAREDKHENMQTKLDCNMRNIQLNVLFSSSSLLEESIPKVKELQNLKFENFNENNNSNPETEHKSNKTIQQHCETDLIVKIGDGIQNIKTSNEIDMKINFSESQHSASREINEPKKKLNVNSKIARVPKLTTGTIRKVSLSKAPEKEIKPKTEPTNVKNSNVSKISKNPSLLPCKPSAKRFKKELTKVLNKDTISNKSTTSTEKSISSNKSHPNNSGVKYAEKPVGYGEKTKECIAKSPRSTVSSNLRKVETQKRQNLFFDLDNIKMSEFLFK